MARLIFTDVGIHPVQFWQYPNNKKARNNTLVETQNLASLQNTGHGASQQNMGKYRDAKHPDTVETQNPASLQNTGRGASQQNMGIYGDVKHPDNARRKILRLYKMG
jgi:hypothetical protein